MSDRRPAASWSLDRPAILPTAPVSGILRKLVAHAIDRTGGVMALQTTGWAADPHALASFLEEPNLCRVATLDTDGDPHVVPAWYHWDGERFYVGCQADDHKVANVRRIGRAAVVIDGDIRRRRGVLIRGTAWVIDGGEGKAEYVRVSTAQVRRYLPGRPPIEMGNKMAEKGEPVVVVIDPERILSWGR